MTQVPFADLWTTKWTKIDGFRLPLFELMKVGRTMYNTKFRSSIFGRGTGGVNVAQPLTFGVRSYVRYGVLRIELQPAILRVHSSAQLLLSSLYSSQNCWLFKTFYDLLAT